MGAADLLELGHQQPILVRDRSTFDDLDENERTFVWGFDDGQKTWPNRDDKRRCFLSRDMTKTSHWIHFASFPLPSLDTLFKWHKLIHYLFLAVTVPLIAAGGGGLAYGPLDHQIGIWHTGAEKRNELE
jgi:hypothetical protein